MSPIQSLPAQPDGTAPFQSQSQSTPILLTLAALHEVSIYITLAEDFQNTNLHHSTTFRHDIPTGDLHDIPDPNTVIQSYGTVLEAQPHPRALNEPERINAVTPWETACNLNVVMTELAVLYGLDRTVSEAGLIPEDNKRLAIKTLIILLRHLLEKVKAVNGL